MDNSVGTPVRNHHIQVPRLGVNQRDYHGAIHYATDASVRHRQYHLHTHLIYFIQ